MIFFQLHLKNISDISLFSNTSEYFFSSFFAKILSFKNLINNTESCTACTVSLSRNSASSCRAGRSGS